MSDLKHTTIEIKIQKFVLQYGAEQLIEWLDEFDFMGGQEKFSQFKKLEKITCDTFEITIADMHNKSLSECTNAKKAISFLASNSIKLSPVIIAKFLGNISRRSVNYYIKDAEGWVNNPRMNKPFFEAYKIIAEKFNTQ